MYSDDDDDSYYCEEGEEDEEVALDEMEPSYNEKTAMLPNTTLLACEILSTDSITSHMQEIIREVTTVIQIPPISIRMLLNYFNWDKERLIEKFFDGDQEKLFRDAKIISPYTNKKAAELPKLDESKEIECAICCCVYKVKETLAMECGHAFCLSCWRQYLQNKIIDEGMGSTISCAQHQCEILMSDEVAILILDDKKILRKYQHLIANQFVESNKLLRWCPKPDCGNVVKVLSHEQRPVKCKCGHEFCFCCGENWHDPVKCMWLRKWIKKCDDDSETSNWISANTKECPQCNSTIEKDGGCNHMVCKKCSHDFCWICLGKWEPHGSSWYNCNRFDESEAKKARDSQEKSRSALQRYLFYCNRYMNHMQSLKFENKLMDNIQSKMEAMQQAGMSWIEVQFLQRAVNVLCQCRQTLMYTYVFAFYLKSSNQSIIFEDNQKDLENSTETLSEYLERDLEIPIKSGNNQLVDVKRKVQDKLRYCEDRRKVLLDHVHEGYDADTWEYWMKC